MGARLSAKAVCDRRDCGGAIIRVIDIGERRAARRYGLNVPIVVRGVPPARENDVLRGRTRNISTGGVYFTTDGHLAVTEALDFSLTFPGLAQGADVFVTGRARVLRLMQKLTTSEPIGVAAVIENFHIVKPEGGRE